MGDGSLAFAPQWLKAGHSSLRSGTQGGATSSKEEGSKGVPWRESGSRLGLGAGADREASELKPLSNHARRQGNSFQDRPSHSRGGDRGLGSRPSNQSRVLSDRELVEQTSSLKLRSGNNSLDSKHVDEKFGEFKETFTPRGTSTKAANRKASGAQRTGNGRVPDRDSGSLNRPQSTQAHLSPSSNLLSPRQELKSPSPSLPVLLHTSPVDQPWNTRLADTPHEVPRPVPSVPLGDGLGPAGQNGLSSPLVNTPALNNVGTEPSVKSTPRMADAIAQAQANAALELEAAKNEKARKEQLVLRQSKQLVPVLAAGKSKQTSGPHGSSNSGAALLRRSSGLDTPKPTASAFIAATKRDADSINGLKKTLRSAPKTNAVETAPVPSAVKPLTKKTSKEKDRLSFFSSLRSKSSSTDARPDSEVSSQMSQGTSVGSKSTAPQIDGSVASQEDEKVPVAPSDAYTNGSGLDGPAKSAEPELLAEEVAFMKSLGWDGDIDGDDAEGGLTEEEIAAFHANKARLGFTTPISIPGKGSGVLNAKHVDVLCQGQNDPKSIAAHSFRSEMEFSDSEAE